MKFHTQTACRSGTGRGLYAANGQRKYLNAEERRRFLQAVSTTDPATQSLCLILAYTGCRISEALALTQSSVQISEGLIAIRSLKKRGRLWIREVPVPDRIAHVAVRQPHLVAPTLADARLYPFGRTDAWKRVKTVMECAGISGLHASPRGLRHGFAVSAVLSGVPISLVQKWLGHAALSTTSIYVNVVGEEERVLAEKVWQSWRL